MNAPAPSSACPQDRLYGPQAARHDRQHEPNTAAFDGDQLPFVEEVMTGSS